MIKEAIATAETVEEAKEAAISELGAAMTDTVDFEIISLPQKKTLGLFGGSLAKVRAFIEIPDSENTTKAPRKPFNNAKPVKKEKIAPPAPKRKKVKSAGLMPAKIKTAIDYLTGILSQMDVTNITIDTDENEEGTVQINIEGDGLGAVIGRRGDTLDALQHLVSLVANNGRDEYVRLTLNPGGYREKRRETLESMAQKAAQIVKRNGRNYVLDPMNAYERRIIHSTVQEIDGVTSWSVGESDHRRVCVGTKRDGGRTFDARNNGERGIERNKHGIPRRDTGERPRRSSAPAASTDHERKQIVDGDDSPLYGRIK